MTTDNLFGAGTPGTLQVDSAEYTFGDTVVVNTAGSITALRFYRTAAMSGDVTVGLWGPGNNGTADRSATVTLSAGSAAWVEVAITAYTVAATAVIFVGYTTATGGGAYHATGSFFSSSAQNSANGALTSPVSTTVNHGGHTQNGRFEVSTGSVLVYPTNSFSAGCFFADLVWTDGATTAVLAGTAAATFGAAGTMTIGAALAATAAAVFGAAGTMGISATLAGLAAAVFGAAGNLTTNSAAGRRARRFLDSLNRVW